MAGPGTLEQWDVSPTQIGSPTLGDILQAITASCEALEMKIETLGVEFGQLKDDHSHLAERVATVEREVADVPATMTGAQARLTELENKTANGLAELQHGQNAVGYARELGLPSPTLCCGWAAHNRTLTADVTGHTGT
ncbi:hypothetical protein NDU88_006499 [Pleurodeles waltl]|uniref:Uncharacterized protein n=1 Tax=Pleurodeles waltl TaxID=8319 RepID=A0AAV7UL59_PLEWA|nr:hypothetical protein NDU88_006499 [Pleurodeles waltl]